jgi:polysaccharide biosynthesis/export protein
LSWAPVAAGDSLAELASPSIAPLVQNIIESMHMTKVKTIAVCVLLLSAGAFGLRLAAQTERGGRKTPDRGQPPAAAKSKVQPPLKLMSEYAVEPPDLVVVEILEALPGRPVSGGRLVRPDGKISLSFYGDIYVAGLTLPEVKEKIVLHMRQFLHDETLGLIKIDENGDPVRDPKTNEFVRVNPRDTDMVFVDVTAYNSKNYYVQGEFSLPGKLPIKGQDRVLDAITDSDGLTPLADHEQVFLYREGGKGEPVQALKIDIDQIMLGDDLSTNYQLLPGDKLVARRRKDLPETKADSVRTESASRPKAELHATNSPRFNRHEPLNPPSEEPSGARTNGAQDPALKGLEKRMTDMERKLEQILEALKRPGR